MAIKTQGETEHEIAVLMSELVETLFVFAVNTPYAVWSWGVDTEYECLTSIPLLEADIERVMRLKGLVEAWREQQKEAANPLDYWKPNIQAIIRSGVDPSDLAVYSDDEGVYYFPDDWKQYDAVDLDRICAAWLEQHSSLNRKRGSS